MNIGLKIKELRHENNLTQEELANQLGVSFQAISRWENGNSLPDITLLPVIANMFDVTVDYLLDLDVDIFKKNEELNKIIEKDNELWNKGKVKKRGKLLLESLKKYPNSWDLKNRLLSVYHVQTANGTNEDHFYQQKTIELGQHILEKCNIDSIRYYAIDTLCFVYEWIGETDKAKKIIENLPDPFTNKNYLMMQILHKEERTKACKEYITMIIEMLGITINYMYLKHEEKIQVLKKYIDILNVIFEDNDHYYYNWRISDSYENIAKLYALMNNKKEMLNNLEKAFEYAQKVMNIYKDNKELKYTSILLRGYSCNPKGWLLSNDLTPLELVKERVFDTSAMEKYFEDEDFISLINKY